MEMFLVLPGQINGGACGQFRLSATESGLMAEQQTRPAPRLLGNDTPRLAGIDRLLVQLLLDVDCDV